MATRAPLKSGQSVARAKTTRRPKKKRVDYENPLRLEESFEAFHGSQPAAFQMFCRYAFELKAAGYPKGSAGMVFERMRWEFATNPDLKGQAFKANNNHRAYYARLAMRLYPEHFGGWFAVRRVTSEGRPPARRR